MHVPNLLQQRFREALESITDEADEFASMIRPTSDPRHGDYQANCAMPLSKRVGRNPRDVAAELVERLKLDDLCEAPEIAGPGFINLKLRDQFLYDTLGNMLGDSRCGVTESGDDRSIVIDFSSPNVAKPMHVGHIRSTVIGDALARSLRFLGYRVITDNHLGDWGTQFGIIIYGYKHFGDPAVVDADPVRELSEALSRRQPIDRVSQGRPFARRAAALAGRGEGCRCRTRPRRRSRPKRRSERVPTKRSPPPNVACSCRSQSRVGTRENRGGRTRSAALGEGQGASEHRRRGARRNGETSSRGSGKHCPLGEVLAPLQGRNQSSLRSIEC